MGSIFREGGRKYFDISYIPERTPHREDEIRQIIEIFERGLEEDIFKIPIIYGPSGTGKTTVIRKAFIELKNKYGGDIEVYILNSLTAVRTYTALNRIASNIIPLPTRGLSLDEMIDKLYNILYLRRQKYLVALDDSDELIRRERGRIIEILTRIEEEYGKRLIYPVVIVRSLAPINVLRDHIRSKLDGPRIEFKPYRWRQLIDIIMERIEYGLKPGSITPNSIKLSAYISEDIYRGNAREMINLVYNAGTIAEMENSRQIVAEHVRKAFYYSYSRSVAPPLEKEDYNILIALAYALSENLDEIYINEDLVYKAYRHMVENTFMRIKIEDFEKLLIDRLYYKGLLYMDEDKKLIFHYYPVTHIMQNI